jgi:hypothetical protein
MLPALAALGPLAAKWWKFAVGAIVGALLIFPVAQCSGKKIGRQEMQLAVERANTAYLQQKARADEAAAAQRITDTIAVNRQEEALRDAIASTPDTQPDAVRIRLGCERLRRANGGNSASLPPVCRPAGGAQAGPAR